MDEPTPGLGHNLPPVSIAEDLATRYKKTLDDFAELREAARAAPVKIEDAATHAMVLEIIKKSRAWEGAADSAREIEREPYKQKVDEINGWFKLRIDEEKKWRKDLNDRHTIYSEAKAAAEKKRLADEADRLKREQEAAEKAAADAEAKKLAAQEAQRKAEAEAAAAEAARQKAIQDKADADARAEKARADEIRLAAERKERERLQAIADAERAERDKADAEAKRIADEQRAAQRKLDDEAAAEARRIRLAEEAKADEAKEATRNALRQQREAEAAAIASSREVKSHQRDETAAMDQAVRHEKRAGRIEAVIAGPEAELARSRSEHGATGTLARRWTCTVIDRRVLDKEALWPFINGEAIDAAAYKWMMAQAPENRHMTGALMQIETDGQVR